MERPTANLANAASAALGPVVAATMTTPLATTMKRFWTGLVLGILISILVPLPPRQLSPTRV
jgi:hypothetical protein